MPQLDQLTAALDTPTITRLNAQVDVEKRPSEEVARDFLVGYLLGARDYTDAFEKRIPEFRKRLRRAPSSVCR